MQSSSNVAAKVRRIQYRNRLIANPRFRHWLAAIPLTRGFVRRRANAMFDINAGFVYSQIALAVIETDLLAALAEGPLSVAAAAAHADLPEAAADRLLKAAAALQLAEVLPDGTYLLGERGAALFADPGIGAMIEHHRHLYRDLIDPVALLRAGGGGGALAAYWAYARSPDPSKSSADSVGAYSSLMARSQAMVAEQVVARYDFGRHRRLLDVGGGEGVFVRAVKAATPALDVAIFDLPAVAERAGDIAVYGGDFFSDALPPGFDIISLTRILHDHDDDAAQRLLRNIAAALAKGDTILVAEPMAGTPGAEAMGDAYFGLYLWAMGSGRPRSATEIGQMLRAAGFTDICEHSVTLPMITRLITARRQ